MSALRAVLFDWDGTLADTAEATYRCYAKLFESQRIAFDREAFRRTYSPNWHHTYTVLGLPRERWEAADVEWLSHYERERVELVPGAREVLQRFDEAGLVQGLVTSGDGRRVGRELLDLGVARFFAVVICAEDIANRKPHPEALLLALARLDMPPAAAAYVGDSPEDVTMAKRAGVFAVGIPGGYPNREALEAASPDVFTEDLTLAANALVERFGLLRTAR